MTAARSGRRDLRRTALTTAAPFPFDFAGTAYSHGWAVLAPNSWDVDGRRLERTERLASGRVVQLTITGRPSASGHRVRVDVAHLGDLQAAEAVAIRRSIRRMFRLDEDMEQFYVLCRKAGRRWESASLGQGRLLRSPTVFEDAVKTICTTNVQWGGTKAMVRGLVRHLGEPGPLGEPDGAGPEHARPNSFPTPAAISAADGTTLDAARLGYRAPYVREMAERVATGDLDLEGFYATDASTEEIRRSLLDIRGVGPYAAATLLMLLGRYDHLAVDTVYRAFVSDRYFGGRRPSDRKAEAVYAGWGRWKYLGYWFDLLQGADERG